MSVNCLDYYTFIRFHRLPVWIYTLTTASETLPMVLNHIQLYYRRFVALLNTKTKRFQRFFFFFFKYCIISSLRVWGSGHGKMTRSITTNHPCLITSVELDCSWEGFSASEKIPWSEWGAGGAILDAEQSSRAPLDGMVWEYGPVPLFFLKPLPDSIMGREKPQSDKSLGGQGTHLVTTTVGIL